MFWKISAISIVILAGAYFIILQNRRPIDAPLQASPTTPSVTDQIPEPVKLRAASYHSHTIATTNPTEEIRALVGSDNIAAVLRINRANSGYLVPGTVITIPDDFAADLSPFPQHLDIAKDIPKLIVIAQRVQAIGLYEHGVLIRWGPTSTGKQETPTQNGLFSTNWKGKEVVSTFDDEWILKWNFNIVNFEGIGMHQYTMPGVPASHSCIRLFETDAKFIYDWADQWILASNGETRLAYGTPVILFGEYAYDESPPWKDLPNDPNATTVSSDELVGVVQEYIGTMTTRLQERERVVNSR